MKYDGSIIPPGTSPDDVRGLLRHCGDYYQCVKDKETGRRLTPLVGLPRNYEKGKCQVGETYYSFGGAQSDPTTLDYCAKVLAERGCIADGLVENITQAFCGLHDEGTSLAIAISRLTGKGWLRAKVMQGNDLNQVTGSMLSLPVDGDGIITFRDKRFHGDEHVIITAGILSDFSVLDRAIELIHMCRAHVAQIACFVDATDKPDCQHKVMVGDNIELVIPVISMIRESVATFRQDDPFVAEDIADGNIVWDPVDPDGWNRLQKSLRAVGVQDPPVF